jgi:hypothetical protein
LNVGKCRASKGVTDRYERLWRSVGEVADFLCRSRWGFGAGHLAGGGAEALLLPSPGRRVDEFVRHSLPPSDGQRTLERMISEYRFRRCVSYRRPSRMIQASPSSFVRTESLADEPNCVAAASAPGVQSLFGNSRIRGILNAYHHVLTIIGPQQRLRPSGEVTYTSCFQYSLTSYLCTSSTQVVSSPCRGISRL